MICLGFNLSVTKRILSDCGNKRVSAEDTYPPEIISNSGNVREIGKKKDSDVEKSADDKCSKKRERG